MDCRMTRKYLPHRDGDLFAFAAFPTLPLAVPGGWRW